MSNAHTPGPWNIYEGNGALVIEGGDGNDIANVLIQPDWDAELLGVVKADANLIASAPELLEACLSLTLAHDSNDHEAVLGAIGLARAAIAKAKGGGA